LGAGERVFRERKEGRKEGTHIEAAAVHSRVDSKLMSLGVDMISFSSAPTISTITTRRPSKLGTIANAMRGITRVSGNHTADGADWDASCPVAGCAAVLAVTVDDGFREIVTKSESCSRK
jgi:hypothetical protein